MEGFQKNRIQELIENQYFGVLATENNGTPYTSLIAYASSPDLRYIIFCTPMDTQKCRNIQSNPRVSFFIDDRINSPEELYSTTGLTVIGTAGILEKAEWNEHVAIYRKKHPYMEHFSSEPSSVFVIMSVDRYITVSNFQTVTILDMP